MEHGNVIMKWLKLLLACWAASKGDIRARPIFFCVGLYMVIIFFNLQIVCNVKLKESYWRFWMSCKISCRRWSTLGSKALSCWRWWWSSLSFSLDEDDPMAIDYLARQWFGKREQVSLFQRKRTRVQRTAVWKDLRLEIFAWIVVHQFDMTTANLLDRIPFIYIIVYGGDISTMGYSGPVPNRGGEEVGYNQATGRTMILKHTLLMQ